MSMEVEALRDLDDCPATLGVHDVPGERSETDCKRGTAVQQILVQIPKLSLV